MTNSRRKGSRREREWAKWLTDRGYPAKRTQQYKGSKDSFDVVSPSHPIQRWEVKGRERLNPFDTIDQMLEEAEGEPCGLSWIKNNRRWLVIMDAEQFQQMIDRMKADMVQFLKEYKEEFL